MSFGAGSGISSEGDDKPPTATDVWNALSKKSDVSDLLALETRVKALEESLNRINQALGGVS